MITKGRQLLEYIKDGGKELIKPGLQADIIRYMKGVEATALARKQLEDEALESVQYATARAARKALPGTVSQKGGVYTFKNMRVKASTRRLTELQKVQEAADRAQSALENVREAAISRAHKRLKAWDMLRNKERLVANKLEAIRRAQYIAIAMKASKK